MKRYTPKLEFDDYGYPHATMVESEHGLYVRADEAFARSRDYKWDRKQGKWVKNEFGVDKIKEI